MNFCGNCGARATGSAYCINCGQPMTAAASQQPAAPEGDPAAPGEGGPGLAPPGAAPAGAAPAQPTTRATNPFAAITISDYVRDGLALLLLLISLGMAWDLEDKATGKVYVILATLLSIISLSLPYLKAAAVLPPHLTPAQLRTLRLAANIPYLVVFLVTLVLGYLGEAAVQGTNVGDGVGVAVAIGLAGVVLAAQGRASEQGASPGDGPLWRAVTLGLAGLAAVLGVLSAVIFLIDLGGSREWSELIVLVLGVLLFVGVPLLLVLGLARGDAGWRDATVVLGLVGLMVVFWAVGADETISEAWPLRLEGPEFLVWPALGAAAAAPGVASQVRPQPGARRWVNLVLRLLNTGVVVAGLAVLIFGFQLVEEDDARGPYITVLVLSLIALAAVVVGRNALAADARAGRQVVMGVAGALIVVGIVKAAVLGASDAVDVRIGTATIISVWIVFAVVIALALTSPKSVRAEMGTFTLGQGGAGSAAAAAPAGAPERTTGRHTSPEPAPVPEPAPAEPGPAESASAAAESGGPEGAAGSDAPLVEPATDAHVAEEPGAAPLANETVLDQTAIDHPAIDQTAIDHPALDEPAAPAAPEPEPMAASDDIAVMASDPNTPLQTLADIAAKEPALRPAIAMNPSTYPELLEWLGQLDDPAVDDALRRRHGR